MLQVLKRIEAEADAEDQEDVDDEDVDDADLANRLGELDIRMFTLCIFRIG